MLSQVKVGPKSVWLPRHTLWVNPVLHFQEETPWKQKTFLHWKPFPLKWGGSLSAFNGEENTLCICSEATSVLSYLTWFPWLRLSILLIYLIRF